VRSGSCLCGGVQYEITGTLGPVIYCHCAQCRKTSGHHVAATRCPTGALTCAKDETLRWYRASDTAERGFCERCGGNLFWKPDHGRHISVFAGTIDTPTGLQAESHIYVADKSDYVEIADGLPQFSQVD